MLQDSIPPPGFVRSLSLQTFAFSAGTGVFFASSVVFFSQYVGLSARDIGLGLSVSAAVGIATSFSLARTTDRVGPQRVWALMSALEACVYLTYPLVGGLWTYLLAMVAFGVTSTTANNARVAYTFSVLPESDRVEALAHVRVALNAGLTLGAGISGVALAVGDDRALVALPLSTCVLLMVSSVMVARLPGVLVPPPHAAEDATPRPTARAVLRDRLFVALTGLHACLSLYLPVLNVVLPLWIIEYTKAPRSIIAWLFILNAVVVIALQVRLARPATTWEGALRVYRSSGLILAATCGAAALAGLGSLPVAASVAMLVVTYLLITWAEMWHAAGEWNIFGVLSPSGRLAEYQAMWSLGPQGASLVGPAALTALVIHGGLVGWAALALVFLLAGIASPPLAAQVLLERRADHQVDTSGT